MGERGEYLKEGGQESEEEEVETVMEVVLVVVAMVQEEDASAERYDPISLCSKDRSRHVTERG